MIYYISVAQIHVYAVLKKVVGTFAADREKSICALINGDGVLSQYICIGIPPSWYISSPT